jgi:hypothetical protein
MIKLEAGRETSILPLSYLLERFQLCCRGKKEHGGCRFHPPALKFLLTQWLARVP